ncbi:MAG TPA: LamG-like jellyroll fold domain-containing protein [Flavobacterium sp.]|jgi:hypothetical protein
MNKIFTIFILVLTINGTLAQDLNADLLLHYTFDNTVADASGNGYTATPFNITYGPDRFGNAASAAYFNGFNSYVNFPNMAELKPQLPVSFSFWIKYDSPAFEQQVVFNTSYEENHATSVVFNASGANYYAINFADGQYFYGSSSRRSFVSNQMIDTSGWKHIVVVVNSADDMEIFINCNKPGGTYSGTGGALQYSLLPGCLGRHDRNIEDAPGYFQGYIDDFRYWDRALTPTDVWALCTSLSTDQYTATKSTVFPNPVKAILNIKSDHAEKVSLYDVFGRTIYAANFTATLDVSAIPAGMYLLQLSGNGNSETHKIIIE